MNDSNRKHFERIIERCESRIANVDRMMVKFAADVTENPAHAFEWADSKMEAAAEHKVASIIKAMAESAIEKDWEPSDLNRQIRDQALQQNKYMNKSTSQCSNFMANAAGAAWIQAMDRFDGLAAFGDQ